MAACRLIQHVTTYKAILTSLGSYHAMEMQAIMLDALAAAPSRKESIHIAPLKITKSSGYRPEEYAHNQMTPPLTPYDEPRESQSTASSFPSFIRAFYPFEPSGTASPSTITLPLGAGNLVLVHSIHTNGWADGTLLDTGARGWLPTNYCDQYDEASMGPLLKALTDLWDVLRSRGPTALHHFHDQDSLRGLIAGVRFLLERSNCLTKEAPTVKQHNNIRRLRKALLSELSGLVKITKSLRDGPTSLASLDDTLSEVLMKAFKIVVRGVRFVDVWTEADSINRALESASDILGQAITADGYYVLRPPGEKLPEVPVSSARSGSALSRGSRRSAWRQNQDPYSRPGTGQSTIRECRTSFQSKRPSLTHRMRSGDSPEPSQMNLASERLKSSHDVFLGCLGTFLGLHMQSRSSAELLLTTQQSVKSCTELLNIIEIVLDHDVAQSSHLVEAKEAMYDNITQLVEAAREIFHPASPVDDEEVCMDDDRKLVRAARDCVRGAGECVAMTRAVLERIGDFEPEPRELAVSIPSIDSPRSTPLTVLSAPSLISEQESSPSLSEPPPLELSTGTPASPMIKSFYSCSPPVHAVEGPVIHTDIPTDLPTPSSIDSPISDSELERFEPIAPISSEISEPFDAAFVARGLVNSAGTNSTYLSSSIDSAVTPSSHASTRATSPGALSPRFEECQSVSGSFASATDDGEDTEAKLMEITFAHELMYNKEGQIIGGTLPALIEKLTASHSTPEAVFVTTFYLTFRLFATPQEFAEALVYRFSYVSERSPISVPVRLRVVNILKGWLETHWRQDCDDVALPIILDFARNELNDVLPIAAKSLIELAEKTAQNGATVPRLVSAISKTTTTSAVLVGPDSQLPSPIISKNQLSALKTWRMGGPDVNILDFDALELARQITIKVSSLFCSILPEELLATEWMKRSDSLAVNVRAMSTLSTDLANLVADSILLNEEAKKRALVIKHWIKIAGKCVDLKNYDSLMAIICALNSSTIARLKRTWELVSQKTQTKLEALGKIVEISRNYITLRQKLQGHTPPCLPFVGVYLTDLTFVDHGNQTYRQLHTEDSSINLINFDKHMKTAKIIGELQRFQIPYKLQDVPELQAWMQDQLIRVRSAGEKSFQNHYRRSLVLEPREQAVPRPPPASTMKSLEFLSWVHISNNG